MIWTYVASLVVSIVGNYVWTGVIRGSIDVGVIRSLFGFASTVGLFTLIIGGFFWFDWYVPLLAILVGSVVAAALVNRSSWPALFYILPIFDALTFASAMYFVFVVT